MELTILEFQCNATFVMSSQATDCCSGCQDPVIVEIPGSPGSDGTAGAPGADGISAYTITTASITLPASAGPVVAVTTVGVSSWAAVGQVIFISDSTNWGHFRVLTIPSATSFTLQWLQYDGDAAGAAVIASGAAVSPSGVEPTGPTAVANGGTGSTTATAARAALGVGGASVTSYASGTAYSLTATPATVTFGTTSPALVIPSAGVWLILARGRIDYNGATFAAVRTGTLLLRRTNNTAANIGDSSGSFLTDIITTLSYTLGVIDLQPIIYTTVNNNDALELWGSISVLPTAGTLDVSEASIVAIKLFDQTV